MKFIINRITITCNHLSLYLTKKKIFYLSYSLLVDWLKERKGRNVDAYMKNHGIVIEIWVTDSWGIGGEGERIASGVSVCVHVCGEGSRIILLCTSLMDKAGPYSFSLTRISFKSLTYYMRSPILRFNAFK